MLDIRLFLLRFLLILCACFWSLANAQELPGPQQLMKDGDTAYTRGDYETARQSFENAWQAAQSLPADSALPYEVLKRLTAAHAASGQFAEAAEDLRRAIEWRESTSGPNDPKPNDSKMGDDLLLSINLDLRTKNFDRAFSTAQRVQSLHIAAYTAESLPVADDLLRIGQIYMAQGKSREVARSLSNAASLRTKLAGSLDPGLLPILDELNKAFKAIQGDSGTGIQALYRQALTIRETLYGPDSSELISTVEGLADTCAAGGEFPAAEPLYQRLLSLWEKTVGKEHPMVAVTLDKLVVFYSKEGETVKAREALERSVAIRARFLAVGLSHLAADDIGKGHPEQAQALYNRALANLDSPDPASEDLAQQIRKLLADITKPAK